MNFTSAVFLIFFPVIWFIYWEIKSEYRKYVLIAASIIFYGYFSFIALLWLLATIFITYLAGIGSPKYSASGKNIWRMTEAAGLLFPLALLVVFKYTPVHNLLLPAGISFYTFQTLSYVLDVWSGKYKCERSFADYMLYVCFFPQLVAGPIERAEHLLPQLKAAHSLNRDEQGRGLSRMAVGFLQKAALADTLAPFVDRVYGNLSNASGPDIIIGTLCFSLQIYFDFAGYSNIAIGAANMLGIKLIENFDHPYLKGSISGFWKSWHMSLTSWLTEYVYIPLGGSRRGNLRTVLNILIVFLLSGIWHGAGVTFAIWGMMHGIFLSFERCFYEKLITLKSFGKAVYGVWCIVLIEIAWVFFRIDKLTDLSTLMNGLCRGWNAWNPVHVTTITGLILFGSGLLLTTVNEKLWKEKGSAPMELLLISGVVIAAALIRNLGTDGSNAFMYFKF